MTGHELTFILFSYLLGGVPVGFLLYYFTEKKDIRGEGSGNIGATNVLRAKGKSAGILTLALDMLKGILPIIYGLKHFDRPMVVLAGGAAVILGHLFSPYLKFKGGKGIATLVGVCLAFHFPSALAFAAGFFIIFFTTRYVSAASIAGVTAAFFGILFTHVVEVAMAYFIIGFLVVVKHRANIQRIINGTENKLMWKTNP